MTNRHEVEWASRTAASGIDLGGYCSCVYDSHELGRCDCPENEDGGMRRDARAQKRQIVSSLTPTLATITSGTPNSTTGSRSRTGTASTFLLKRDSSSASTNSPSFPTIRTITIPPTPPSTSFSSYSTHTFHPSGIQSVVPTYPPFTSTPSSTSTSTSTTDWSSLGTKIGLGIGVPILVLLTLLLTSLLYRRQVRCAKHDRSYSGHHNRHRYPPPPPPPPPLLPPPPTRPARQPEMATAPDPTYPRLHPIPSSRFSTAGDIVVTPAQQQHHHQQLLLSPPPPKVPRRNSARLLSQQQQQQQPPPPPLAGPLDSHPPVVRPPSSIYESQPARWNSALRDSSYSTSNFGGGNAVGDVLAEYLDFNPQHLDGPWDLGQTDVPAWLLPPEQRARNRPQGHMSQYLSVDVIHSPEGIDEVSPLSSSGSGPYVPNRISAMSAPRPSNPVRTHSRRRF